MNVERWLPIDGYEGRYSVSDFGRVRSHARLAKYKNGLRSVPDRILKARNFRLNTAHLAVILYRADGLEKNAPIATLVAAAFIGPRPTGMHVCHNDGDATNNTVSNLRYDTPAGNSADRITHGTSMRGEKHPQSKLTERDVLAIRSEPKGRRPLAFVAAQYGISVSHVSTLRQGRTWEHL